MKKIHSDVNHGGLKKIDLGIIHKVRTLKFDNVQTPPPTLYAFKQQNVVIKQITYLPWPPPLPPLKRTYIMDGPLGGS